MKLYAFNVTIHLKSGAAIRTRVTRLIKKFNGNELTGLEWTGRMPFYIRLDDISAIESRPVLNWRKGFRE